MVDTAIWLSQESSKVQRHKVYVTSTAIKLIDRTEILDDSTLKNKLASLEAALVRNYDPSTHWQG